MRNGVVQTTFEHRLETKFDTILVIAEENVDPKDNSGKETNEGEDEEELEQVSKTPTRHMQKNHLKDQIIGDKNKGVQRRKRVVEANKQENYFFFHRKNQV